MPVQVLSVFAAPAPVLLLVPPGHRLGVSVQGRPGGSDDSAGAKLCLLPFVTTPTGS